MTRQASWRADIADAMRKENWSLQGPTRIVKVVASGRALSQTLTGFVCQEKSLIGKTPAQIEPMLGLPPGHFRQGCRIYKLTRLPLTGEVEYELTAAFPNGLSFNPAMHDAAYQAGSASVHQWRLLSDIPAQLLVDLKPAQRFAYRHGS